MTTPHPVKATVNVSRVIRAPPDHVYGAFLDPDALAKWIPPAGYTGRVHEMQARVGGAYRMSFTSLDKRDSQTFGGKFLELTPNTRIRYTDQFETDKPEMAGEILTTITLREVPEGTEVKAVQENLPPVIPVEDAVKGWKSSLQNLAGLLERPQGS